MSAELVDVLASLLARADRFPYDPPVGVTSRQRLLAVALGSEVRACAATYGVTAQVEAKLRDQLPPAHRPQPPESRPAPMFTSANPRSAA